MTEIIQKPKVTAGALISNKNGKFLLIKSPKWKDMLIVPGGHVEWGESIEEALKREVKEETGLEIYDLKFIKPFEFIFHEDYSKDRHIISLNFNAKTDADEKSVQLDGEEGSAYEWLTPEEIFKREDVHPTIKEALETYLETGKTEEYKTGWQRALADYHNLQKEVRTRQAEWAAMSEQQILEEFIPVYDNFKTAFHHHPKLNGSDEQKQIKNWVDGIGHIMKQFGEILKNHKIEEIKTVGEKFDPVRHEAVGEEEGNKGHGIIVREISGGYKMSGRIIKPARVIINK